MTKDKQIKELTERNDDLENYFRNTIIPQLFIDDDLILRKYTPAAMKQFKLTADDIGKNIHDVINNFRFPSIIENIHWVINTSEILEKEIQTTDLKWYQMNILPYIKLADKRTNGVIITFVDITLRIKDLKEQEKLISDHEILLDTISHDFGNLLTGLILSIDMLNTLTFENQDEYDQTIQILENGVKRIQKFIDQLTADRKKEQQYQAVDELLMFENILEDVHFALLDKINESDARINCEINVSEITFSRRKLRSLFYNLISNAIKFRLPGRNPEIFIKTIREDQFIIISVKDNGVGIAPSSYDDIFSKYFRIEESVEGSGIGLHLVNEIVKSANGKIVVESQLNKGTEFKVYLKVE